MKAILTHISHSELVRNSAKLLGANVLAQAIGLLVYPVLTRLYQPEDFGLMNLFLSLGGLLSLFATAEYQYAIVLPRDEQKSRALVRLCWWIVLGVMMVVVVSLPFSNQIARCFKTPDFAGVYYYMPLFVLVSGAWNIFNYTFTREKLFSRVSDYQLTQSIVSSVLKIGFGFLHWASGLVVGSVLAPVAALAVWRKREHWKVTSDEVREVAGEYRKFPLYSLPRAVVNNLSGNMPAYVLTPFFGTGELGYFALALTLAFRPLNMISASLNQTFFQRTAEAVNRRQTIWPFFRKFIGYTLLIVCPSFAILYVILPWLTGWLLGAGYEQTGELIRVMLPWLMMSMLVAPICFLSDVFGQQRMGLAFEILFLLARLAGMGVGIYLSDFYYAIVGYAVGGALVIGAQLVWLMTLVRRYERSRA